MKSNDYFLPYGRQFIDENDIQFSYIQFRDLTLNAKIEKDKFFPGPLVKILSLINENNFQTQSSLKNILNSKIVIGKINLLLINDKNSQKEEILEGRRCKVNWRLLN